MPGRDCIMLGSLQPIDHPDITAQEFLKGPAMKISLDLGARDGRINRHESLSLDGPFEMHMQLSFIHRSPLAYAACISEPRPGGSATNKANPLQSRNASFRSRLSFVHTGVEQVTPNTLYISCA